MRDDDDLDAFFAAARRHPADPSPDFMARLLADAATAQAGAGDARPSLVPRPALSPGGLWRQLREMLGGWPAQGGLAAAGLAGLALGLALPLDGALMTDLTALALGQPADTYLVDPGTALDFDLAMDLNGG